MPSYKAEKVRLGNALADVTVVLATAQVKAGMFCEFEQPGRSLMLLYKPIFDMMAEHKFIAYRRDSCLDGAPWRKPLLVITPCAEVGKAIEGACPGGRGHDQHIVLRGPAPDGVPWTRVAASYWPAWARTVARAWGPVLSKWQATTGSSVTRKAVLLAR